MPYPNPNAAGDFLAVDPTQDAGRIDFGQFGSAPGFANTARTQLNASLGAQERASKMAVMDDTSRFNNALGAAQAAIIGKQRQGFADQAVQGGLNIGLQTAQQDLEGRRMQGQMAFQQNESALGRLHDRYLTGVSLTQRQNELKLMQEEARRKELMGYVGAALGLGGSLAGAVLRNPQTPQNT